jgi:integrase
VLKTYRTLEVAAEDGDKPWWAAARRMTTVALSTGLRHGELLGLRWQDVELLERRLHVVPRQVVPVV